MNYLLRRLGFYLVAAWASISLNFLLPRLMPGDPANAVFAGAQGRLDPSTIAAMREAYGLSDDPLLIQYWSYLKGIARLDFGISTAFFPTPVLDVVKTGLSWTLLLGVVATIIAFGLGSLIGVISAWRRGGVIDSAIPPLALFIGSFPYFWLATFIVFYLGFRWSILPEAYAYELGLSPEFSWNFVSSVIWHLILPASTVVLVSLGGWILGMRNTMVSTLSEDYVSLAEAKGLSQRRVMLRYAARNALLPNMTSFGMSLGFVLSGSLITESVFNYPGLGNQLVRAVRLLDFPLMQTLFLFITISVLVANLLVDLLYLRLDPRVRS
jgi:peptide/nickel transport system permease protein